MQHTTPVVSRVVEASSVKPYVALIMTVDMNIIRSLYDELSEADLNAAQALSLDAGETDQELIQAMGRLFRLAGRPTEVHVLAPLVRREIHFRLLMARHGAMLRQLLRHESVASRIAKSINRIRQEFRTQISVPELARTAGMSPSTFHESVCA